MLTLKYPAPAAFPGKTVHVRLHDGMSDLAEDGRLNPHHEYARDSDQSWFGYHSFDDAVRLTQTGDISLVASSDALLDSMERHAFETVRRATVNDVAGGFPDVPAFIAGHPMSMRRRARVTSDGAPIAIIVDLSISSGLNASQIANRGAAVLALVRALTAHRPVELWAVSGMDTHDAGACFVGTRIDTTPLDLARAAYALTSASLPRRLLYSIAASKYGYTGRWPFRNGALTPENMASCLAPAFTHIGETLCIPGAHVRDPIVDNPEAWLAARIAERGAEALDEAA